MFDVQILFAGQFFKVFWELKRYFTSTSFVVSFLRLGFFFWQRGLDLNQPWNHVYQQTPPTKGFRAQVIPGRFSSADRLKMKSWSHRHSCEAKKVGCTSHPRMLGKSPCSQNDGLPIFRIKSNPETFMGGTIESWGVWGVDLKHTRNSWLNQKIFKMCCQIGSESSRIRVNIPDTCGASG